MKFTAYCTLSGFAAAFTHVALAMPTAVKSGVTESSTPLPMSASFTADPSINVAGIYAAAQASNSHILATYPTTPERKAFSNIYGDWQNLTDVSAFHFIADMDVDCDGPKSNCKRWTNSDVFWGPRCNQSSVFVLPERFTIENKAILKDNALGAIICDGKMFYGITATKNIVFGSEVPPGIQKSNIDISALKALGDAQMILLQKALHL
ncbi:hypothetical protein B0H13DRAFT_2486854 [Mycena leptocephala]|nr:hypothetical protein B0H13DRAFT_2486854 [Mycena leptocephala]